MARLAPLALLLALLALAVSAPAASAQGGTGGDPAGDALPTPEQIAAAKEWVKSRQGRRGFAVVDSQGRLDGLNVHARFVTASVVKAMLLVEYLRMLERADRPLTQPDRDLLGPMIRVSSNEAATAIYRRMGDAGLRRLARRTGMEDFAIGPAYLRSCRCRSGAWARAQLSAADQARFFWHMDRFVPRRFREYARGLLSTVVASQAWGVPAAVRPDWTPFWKVGVRGSGLGVVVHQAARIEQGDTRIGVAVMTDGNPSLDYGKRTIFGVGEALVEPPAPVAR